MEEKIFEYGGDEGSPVRYYKAGGTTEANNAIRALIEDFARAFRSFLPSLKNGSLTLAGASKDKIPKFKFEFHDSRTGSYQLGASMRFWVYAEDLRAEPDKSTGTISYPGGDLTAYSANPLDPPLPEAKRKLDLMGILYARNPDAKFEDTKGGEYLGFTIGGRRVYLEREQALASRSNLRDWGKHFRRKDESFNGDILCERGLRGEIDSLEAEAKRELIVRHPLEWDKRLYDTGYFRDRVFRADEEGYTLLREEAAALDIWEGLKQTEEFGKAENDFHFAHPVYFVNHLEKMGAFEMNPYYGERTLADGRKFSCVDNPGFAPLQYGGTRTKFEYDDEYYAEITGLFNAKYDTANPKRAQEDWKYYWHEGIDFDGGEGGAPIKSLIHGEVIQSGTSAGGMGEYVVARDRNNPNLYYVLVHLASYSVHRGDALSPGDIIGTVGQDRDKTSNPHLHVTHILASAAEEVVNAAHRFPFWDPRVGEGHESRKKVVDPFDHRNRWKGRWKN
jgi:murein DD-endopeptidase MepM/ murein hydrolase activator NlpD